MKVIHVGGHSSTKLVDGINAVIWSIATQQVRFGHQVGLLVSDPPDEPSRQQARARGVELLHLPSSCWWRRSSITRILNLIGPVDIVHLHSMFVPHQAALAWHLRQLDIPYVVTPHGGLMPGVFQRGRLKKSLYGALIERRRIRQSAGIAFVTPNAESQIRAYAGDFNGLVRWIPNPVNIMPPDRPGWNPDSERPQLSFLGRFDVCQKGLDRLAEIARFLPEADFNLYGVEESRTRRHLAAIQKSGPPNLRFHPPIFGNDKLEMLESSTMYIQVSRWESLSISVLEAMAMGVPCAISESMSMAGMFTTENLGLVVSTEPQTAAAQIREAMTQSTCLAAWSKRSRAYTQEHFAPAYVARQVINFYQDALAK